MHPSERIRTWVDAICRLADQDKGVSFKPRGGGFAGRLDSVTVGGWRLARVAAESHSLRLEPIERHHGPTPLLVIIQLKGSCTLGRDGEEVQVGTGEAAIVSLNRPLTLANEPFVEQYILWGSAPQTGSDGRITDFTRVRRMAGQTAIQGLLRSMVETLFAQMPTAPGSAEFLAQTISWLVGQALSEPDQGQPAEVPARLSRERIVRHIEDNLHDPELSPERIALALGCSKRTLHRAFDNGSGDESLNRYLWRRRIERCAAELRSLTSAGRRRTVTEIAYSFGFSSSAHFSRRFKQHLGVTPLSFRQVPA